MKKIFSGIQSIDLLKKDKNNKLEYTGENEINKLINNKLINKLMNK